MAIELPWRISATPIEWMCSILIGSGWDDLHYTTVSSVQRSGVVAKISQRCLRIHNVRWRRCAPVVRTKPLAGRLMRVPAD